jgi:8-oxo-dGTP diphosphatase
MESNKQITIIVGCVIKENKILMIQRNEQENQDIHLKWQFPGGNIEFDETIEEAVEREVYEETGIVVKAVKILPFSQTVYWNYSWGKQQTLCFCYLCDFINESEQKKDDQVENVEWIPIKEADTLPSLPGTKQVIDVIKKELKVF